MYPSATSVSNWLSVVLGKPKFPAFLACHIIWSEWAPVAGENSRAKEGSPALGKWAGRQGNARCHGAMSAADKGVTVSSYTSLAQLPVPALTSGWRVGRIACWKGHFQTFMQFLQTNVFLILIVRLSESTRARH